MVKAVPDEYHSITPYLTCQGAAQVIDFVKEAFGAQEIMQGQPGRDGDARRGQSWRLDCNAEPPEGGRLTAGDGPLLHRGRRRRLPEGAARRR